MSTYKKIISLGIVALLCLFNAPYSFASKYDAIVEKVVMKKQDSKRLAFTYKLEKALMGLTKKINAKTTKTSKDKKLLTIIPGLEKAIDAVQVKLEKKKTAPTPKEDTIKDSGKNSGKDAHNSKDVHNLNASARFYVGTKTQAYIKESDKLSGGILERRKKYIDDAMKRNGFSRSYAEQLADLYIGKAPTPLKDGVDTVELIITPKTSIIGKNCRNEQQWKSPGVKGEMKVVCRENGVSPIEYLYKPWLSQVIGFDVYGEKTSNELQVNRYMVDYKKGLVVYAEYSTSPMHVKSNYFKADIYTTSLDKAKEFNKETFKEIIKGWNTVASNKRNEEYKKMRSEETEKRKLPAEGTLKVNGLKYPAKSWAKKYSWEGDVHSAYFTSNAWSTITNRLTGVKIGDRANGIITIKGPGSKCGFHYTTFRKDAGSSNVYVEGITPGVYNVTCDKLK